MLLLAIDTSTPQVGVAVCRDGEALARFMVIDARRHGELLAVGVRQVLAEAGVAPAQLEGVAVGVGPGPYTGLRIGLMTARAMGHALGIGVHGVCSLDALAAQAGLPGEFLVATDARRKEVYWARYDDGVRVDGPGVARPHELGWTGAVVGAGPELYPEAFGAGLPPVHPDPAVLAHLVEQTLAAGEQALPPDPLYLRRPDAVEPGAAKTVGQPRVGDPA